MISEEFLHLCSFVAPFLRLNHTWAGQRHGQSGLCNSPVLLGSWRSNTAPDFHGVFKNKIGTHYHSLGSFVICGCFELIDFRNKETIGYFPVVKEKFLIPKWRFFVWMVLFFCCNFEVLLSRLTRGGRCECCCPVYLKNFGFVDADWFCHFGTGCFARKNNLRFILMIRCMLIVVYCCQTSQVDQNEILSRVLETCCVRCYSCLVWKHVFDF